MAATGLTFPAARRENDWINFVGGVPSCASTANSSDTFDCLRKANSSDILAGLLTAIHESPELFAFSPTLDGPDGLYPEIASALLSQGHFARLPFIAGTNLDEGDHSLTAYTYNFIC